MGSGYWFLYRYDPRLKEAGKSPLVLDSKEPTEDFQEFLMGEVRYSRLTRTFPENAKSLFAIAEMDVKARYALYKTMAAEQPKAAEPQPKKSHAGAKPQRSRNGFFEFIGVFAALRDINFSRV